MSELEQRKGATYAFATIGARTERGGYVTRATSRMSICGLAVARVGDVVTYNDASEAAIIDGAGALFVDNGQCGALVGSRLSNGDRIVSTPWENGRSGLFVAEGQTPEGLFDPHYAPPQVEPGYRLAIYGATTARGGILREPAADWRIDGREAKVGTVGDAVQYPDGTTARIVSGLVVENAPDFVPLAFVGSELDNGDTITDSPERKGDAPRSFKIARNAQ